jgi:hypothetical protein
MDDVLEHFVDASQDTAEEQLGDLLADHASPIIRRVIASRLGGTCTEADDVHAQVLLQLMLRLREGRIEKALGVIDAFGAYVATAAHHGCDHYLRHKYPLRWRLRSRMRYLLEHDRSLALWKSAQGTWRCGERGWQAHAPGVTPPPSDVADIDPGDMKRFLVRAFQRSGGPLELSALVDLAAAAWHIPLFHHEDVASLETFADRRSGADVAMAQRERAGRAWQEIRALPLRQRQALLLNLKDDALSLFLLTGTASLRAIASSLDLSVEALAAVWNDLPLPDNDVAARLGCTRQQVINLRMAARKRLANHLGGAS